MLASAAIDDAATLSGASGQLAVINLAPQPCEVLFAGGATCMLKAQRDPVRRADMDHACVELAVANPYEGGTLAERSISTLDQTAQIEHRARKA